MAESSSPDFSAFDAYVDRHFDDMVVELRDFCSRPTLAGQRIGLTEGIEAVRGLMGPLGSTTKVAPAGDGPPAVIGELGEGERTLLFYNHYDVQPPEPLDLWESPPYSGEVRDGKFYARGVSDDRGDFISRVFAIRAHLATLGVLPLKVKWLVEGEEEIGSPHFADVVRQNAEALKGDWCAWESAGYDVQNRPQVVCGLKGMLYVELHATGPDHDAHSGMGGILPNPAWRLVSALGTLRDARGNFVMDGLDDILEPPSPADIAAMDAMPWDNDSRLQLCGLKGWQRGLQGREALRALLFEPTANIAGFTSGYSGEGAKTIVPSKAVVKMDFRLVPGQSPEKMLDLLRAHLSRRGFDDVEVLQIGRLEVARTPVDSPLVRASIDVWNELGFDNVVVEPTSGGSGPMSFITSELGLPTVMAGGLSWAGSRVHSPNESIRLEDLRTAVKYWGRFFSRMAALA